MLSQECLKKELSGRAEKVALFLRAIAEKNRLRILCLLQRGERCVCEICRELNLPQNLVSHHLKVLKDIGIVSCRREGTKAFYKLNKMIFRKYVGLLRKIL